MTSDELAKKSDGEELLITRLLRALAGIGIVGDVGERTWVATPVTHAMAHEGVSAGFRMMSVLQSKKHCSYTNGFAART
jgi:hypothetical protein